MISLKVIGLISACIFFTDAAEVATSGSGKAIYTSSRNPISSYFKEQKNKLRPYFNQQSTAEQTSSPYSQGISVIDETNASGQPSQSYSHSNYYDSTSPFNNNNYQSAASAPKESNYDGGNHMDLYESSNPDHGQASNNVYSVMDTSNSGYTGSSVSTGSNPGYYGGDSHHPAYNYPQSSDTNTGYYGPAAVAHIHQPADSSYHDNSIYPISTSSNIVPPLLASHGDTSKYGDSALIGSSVHHHTPTSNSHNHNSIDKNSEASNNSDFPFAIPGGHEEDEVLSENGFLYDYNTNTDDDDMVMDIPLSGLLGGGGGGDAPAVAPPATQAPADNPLSFLNLVGTDFQPGRLVNIFFGLFIMLFMIITHGYALWILGIAYLPGTRSLNHWEFDMNKVEGICDLVLDAIDYWEKKVD